jgi:hypothetical protein
MPKDDRMAQNLQLLAFRSLKAAVDNTLSNKVGLHAMKILEVPRHREFFIFKSLGLTNEQITARKISSTHDLRLITQIYQQQGYKNELLSILQDGTIGVTSSVGKNDVEFIRREIELLLSEKKFKELHDTCYSRLNELRRTKADAAKAESIDLLSWADDWFVWTALLKSDEQLKNTE